MTCKYCNGLTGKCDFWSDDEEEMRFEHIINSCDDEGHCLVDEDDDPTHSCEDFEEC